MNQNMSYVHRFSWLPVMGTNKRLKEFRCTNLSSVAKLPVMTHKQAEEKGFTYDDYGFKYITERALIDLIIGDLEAGYDGLPKVVVDRTRKLVKAGLYKTKETVYRKRIRCRNPLCKKGPGRGFRARPALFYPHETRFDPYCSAECRKKHLKKAGYKFVRDKNGNLVKRYFKKCTSCGKGFWGPKTRKRCPTCIRKRK